MSLAVRLTRFASIALVATGVHCGKGAAQPASSSNDGAATARVDSFVDAQAQAPGATDGGDAAPMDAREADAWARAADGGDDDELRLADLVGCTGLRERASDPRVRRVAARSMAYCRDVSELPWLAALGAHGLEDEALDALDAVVEQAARVRKPVDPEDADELHAGCAILLTLARTLDAPAPRRVRAIRALRMLADRGCVARADIPADLDAK